MFWWFTSDGILNQKSDCNSIPHSYLLIAAKMKAKTDFFLCYCHKADTLGFVLGDQEQRQLITSSQSFSDA